MSQTSPEYLAWAEYAHKEQERLDQLTDDEFFLVGEAHEAGWKAAVVYLQQGLKEVDKTK